MRSFAILTLLAAALGSANVDAVTVGPCDVDVGQCSGGLVGLVQDCIRGEVPLCETQDTVIHDCLQGETQPCTLVLQVASDCVEGTLSGCRDVVACVQGEPGLCQTLLNDAVCTGSNPHDVCDQAVGLVTACGSPGGVCHTVASVILECTGSTHQPSPLVPCETTSAEIFACLNSEPGLCEDAQTTVDACVDRDITVCRIVLSCSRLANNECALQQLACNLRELVNRAC